MTVKSDMFCTWSQTWPDKKQDSYEGMLPDGPTFILLLQTAAQLPLLVIINT